jgi:DNA repair exonuclease SbcCD ATPase subunit
MLILEQVNWGDCFSYGKENELKLNENTITQLIGDNGAGKSSISLIIQEALYNKNSKGIKKANIPNRVNDVKQYWIDLQFSYNDKQYIIKIKRRGNLKVNLLEDGVDISSHTATETFKTIEKILGIDYKVFVQLMYQSVTDGLSFLTATDANRKKFLIDLFGLDEYDKYHNIFKELTKELNTKVTRIHGNIDSIQKWINKNKDIPEEKPLLEQPEEPKDEDEVWALRDKVTRIKEINRKINTNNKFKELIQQIEYDDAIIAQEKEDTRDLTLKVGEQTAIVNSSTALINKMAKLGNNCPTCFQKIDESETKQLIQDEEESVETAEAKIAALQAEIKRIREKNSLIDHHKKQKSEWESIYVQIDDSLQSTLENIDDLTTQIDRIEQRTAALKARYDIVLRQNNEITAHNSRIAVISEQLAEHSAELTKYKNILREATETLSIAETLKKAFSTNGLVAHKLENLVKDIEELTNMYLADLSDGRFTLLFTIVADKLNVVLTDNGEDIDISALSSGELAMVNVATLLAIRKMMNSISKTQINILFLDEAINVLAEHGRDCLIEVLLKEEGLNTFLVSHGWSHPLLAKVLITKQDGISRLNYG